MLPMLESISYAVGYVPDSTKKWLLTKCVFIFVYVLIYDLFAGYSWKWKKNYQSRECLAFPDMV